MRDLIYSSLIAFFALMLVCPTLVAAGDTDPEGVRLKALAKENPKLQEALNKGGDKRVGTDWRIVCDIECGTEIGHAIWAIRYSKDLCCTKLTPYIIDAEDYCTLFSKHCRHYHWNKECLKHHGCPKH